MKTLKKFDFSGCRTSPTGSKGKYDWDLLLNGSIHQLTAGEDYTNKHFLHNLRVKGKKMGKWVIGKAMTYDDGSTGLVIQAVPLEGANGEGD